jgi:RHS repeat-associated protein
LEILWQTSRYEEVGLIYFVHRYYDFEIGGWITPDPVGDIDGLHLYIFAQNNPITYVDYFGLAAAFNVPSSTIISRIQGGKNFKLLIRHNDRENLIEFTGIFP